MSETTTIIPASVNLSTSIDNITIQYSGNPNVLNVKAVTFGLLSVASQAQGDIMYFNGTSWVRLGAGTSGQFLKTQGASANPKWDGLGLTLLTSGTFDTTSSTEVELMTYTVTAGAFTANDRLLCAVYGEPSDATNVLKMKLVAPNTATGSLIISQNIGGATNAFAFAYQNASVNTLIDASAFGQGAGGSIASVLGSVTGADANWITTAFVVSLRGANNGGGHYYGRYAFYKMQMS